MTHRHCKKHSVMCPYCGIPSTAAWRLGTEKTEQGGVRVVVQDAFDILEKGCEHVAIGGGRASAYPHKIFKEAS